MLIRWLIDSGDNNEASSPPVRLGVRLRAGDSRTTRPVAPAAVAPTQPIRPEKRERGGGGGGGGEMRRGRGEGGRRKGDI